MTLKDEGVSVAEPVDSVKDASGALSHHDARDPFEPAPDPIETSPILSQVRRELKKELGGDLRIPLLLYIAMTSRVLTFERGRTVLPHMVIKGPSSHGKTRILNAVQKLFPVNETYVYIKGATPTNLVYGEQPLEHRALILEEAALLPKDEDSSLGIAVKHFLEDDELYYDTTRKSGEHLSGRKVQEIRRKGPAVVITTTTRAQLPDQYETRFFSIYLPHNQDRTAAILESEVQQHITQAAIDCPASLDLQRVLQAKEWNVLVPFAGPLSKALADMNPSERAKRDFPRLLSLIQAITVLHHNDRSSFQTTGRLRAELEDYEILYELGIEELMSDTMTEVPKEVREVVTAVHLLLDIQRSRGSIERVTRKDIYNYLDSAGVTSSYKIVKRLVDQAKDLGTYMRAATRTRRTSPSARHSPKR